MSKESTGKRIADELRVCAGAFIGVWVDSVSQTITFTTSNVAPTVDSIRMDSNLLAIADRIDAAHEEAIASVMNDALYHANDKDMAELGWYRALDADKQPIKFGDEVEWWHPCGSCELRHGIVTGIKTDYVDGELFHEVTVNVDRFTVRLMASQLRHYHAPTVEDVLREFYVYAERGAEHHREDVDDAVLAEYAAKLRLAGDTE